ncbi:unnamed protein product [Strongylus vulgaris]|uniref:Uncharacterized protein n=1 Tax=Strongylus vulgaris TaxID=40348 RepID=A0A3P7I9I4_STRVU|nr:unnamed protein product [Strongylus vulgaris]
MEQEQLVENLRKQLSEKDEELRKNKQEFENNQNEITKLDAAHKSTKEIAASLQSTASSLTEELNRVSAEKDELRNAKNKAEKEVTVLKTKLENLSRQMEETKKLR